MLGNAEFDVSIRSSTLFCQAVSQCNILQQIQIRGIDHLITDRFVICQTESETKIPPNASSSSSVITELVISHYKC